MQRRFVLGVAVSAVLLAGLFLKVPLGGVRDAFEAAAPRGLALAVAMHLGILCMKAMRWHVVLQALPHPRPAPDRARRWLTFDALFFGYFGNYVLPAKLGELGRSLLYSRRAAVPFSSVLATIVFERLLDAVTLVSFAYGALWLLPLPDVVPDWLLVGARAGGTVGMLGLVGLWVATRVLPVEAPGGEDGLKGKVVHAVFGLLASFREGLSILRDPRRAAVSALWTVSIWLVECVSFWICLEAFGVDVLPSGAVLWVVAASFAAAAPAAPGGLGVHQWVSVLILAPYGVPESTATAASLVVTFSFIFWVVPIGLFGFWRQGLSPAQLRADLEANSGQEPAAVSPGSPAP